MAFHIFTVTEETFEVHLKYKFAWTWFNPTLTESQNESDFDWSHDWVAEDIICCKKWDIIIFYVMWVWFFWFFEIVSTPFFEKSWKKYKKELWIKLPYRLLFKVSKEYWLFLNPSPEWETTDDLSLFDSPKVSDIQWNWLYKKLSWNRWCLHIFDWEGKNIFKILDFFNQSERVTRNIWLQYDKINHCIITTTKTLPYEWNIDNYIQCKINKNGNYIDSEHSLEFYIIENRVKDIIWNNNKFLWCQTFASLWKRAIDILSISENDVWRIIELKKSNITPKLIKDALNQINKYIKWAKSRYKENINWIIPILVFWPWLKKEKANWEITSNYSNILSFISDFNDNSNVEKIKIFEYELISDDKLKFNEFKYD